MPDGYGNQLAPIVPLLRLSDLRRVGAPSFKDPVMSIPFVRLMVSAAFMILCGMPGSARAGDIEDCNGLAAEKIEAGCTAISTINRAPPRSGCAPM